MDKIKAFFLVPGRMRMIAVAYIVAVVALKAFGLDGLVQYLSFAAPFLPTDSPVSAADASAAILGIVAMVKAIVQWLRSPEPAPKA